jgi:uncharacterized protein (TIGR00369 family)
MAPAITFPDMSDPPVPPTAVEVVQTMVLATPYARALDMRVVSVGEARVCMAIPYRADLVGDPDSGVIAGGALTALLDHVCGAAVMSALKVRRSIATLDLRIDYMRGAEPGRDILAQAHCYKVTRAVAFVRAVAFEESADNPVANASGAFMISDAASPRMGANLRGANLKAPK